MHPGWQCAVLSAFRTLISIPFQRRSGLIVVSADLWGPQGSRSLVLVLDTGAVETLIPPDILNELGYSVRDHEGITVIRSAVAKERGYLMRVSRFRALGHELSSFRIHAHDLPGGYE